MSPETTYNMTFEGRVESRLASLEKGLSSLEKVLDRIELRLFGNGQPGELTMLKRRVTVQEEFRIRAQEKLSEIDDMQARLTASEEEQAANRAVSKSRDETEDRFWTRLGPFVPWIGWIIVLAAAGYFYIIKGGKLPG